MNKEDILDPLDYYLKVKDEFLNLSKERLEDLEKESNINIEENQKFVKEYLKLKDEINNLNKKLKGKKVLKGFLIFFIVLSFLAIPISFYLSYDFVIDNELAIIISILCLILAIILIIIIKKKINKIIKSFNEQISSLEKKKTEAYNNALKEVAPLLNKFDYNEPLKLINKLNSIISVYDNFNIEAFTSLKLNYGLKESLNENVSVYNVILGKITSNYFLELTSFNQTWIRKAYSGSITIFWESRHIDSNGREVVEHHSQVLTATIYKPAPNYFYENKLIYTNKIASNLSFVRKSSNTKDMDEKKLDKYINKKEKELEQKMEKIVSKGGSYTKMGNAKFEVLFNDTNRNDEIEYRLLFTPLAQENMVKLFIDSNSPYKDDFTYLKKNELNYIKSKHSQEFNYETNPNKYYDFDYKEVKRKYLSFNSEFFKSLYFDLAPILAIPIYQQESMEDENKIHEHNVSGYEAEAILNKIDEKYLKPEGSITKNIYKAYFENSTSNVDTFKVVAFGYLGIKRVDIETRIGGDGHMHNIPVEWIEYIEVKKESFIHILNYDISYEKYKEKKEILTEFINENNIIATHFERGLLSFVSNCATINIEKLKKL